MPPSAGHCSVVELAHGYSILQQVVFKPEKAIDLQASSTFTPQCALNHQGSQIAVAFGDGYVCIFNGYASLHPCNVESAACKIPLVQGTDLGPTFRIPAPLLTNAGSMQIRKEALQGTPQGLAQVPAPAHVLCAE